LVDCLLILLFDGAVVVVLIEIRRTRLTVRVELLGLIPSNSLNRRIVLFLCQLSPYLVLVVPNLGEHARPSPCGKSFVFPLYAELDPWMQLPALLWVNPPILSNLVRQESFVLVTF
jgi:hypothetical protein